MTTTIKNQKAADAAAAPTFDDRAVMISIRTRKLGNRRQVEDENINEMSDDGAAADWDASRPVAIAADKSSVCITKRIFDCDEFNAIKNLDSRVERFLKDKCLPSPLRRGKGIFLLPYSLVDDVDARLVEFQAERLELIDAFVAVYAAKCAEESARLRKLHRPADYLPLALVRGAFEFDWQYVGFSVPTALAGINKEIWRREQAKTAAAWDSARAEIRNVLRASMAELVDHMVDRLKPDPETGKPKTLKSISKMQDFLATFQARNLADDAQLAELVERARKLAIGVTADDLKAEGVIRAKAQAGFAQIKKELDAMVIDRPKRKIRFEEAA